MRTRSDAARQRSLLKLPEDCIRHVALFIDRDVHGARFALTSRRVMRSLTSTVWAQILKASHGGLKITAADLDDGLRVAARLAAARADKGPVDGFFALATNCGAAPGPRQQRFWADALFQREPWRIYCSRSNPDGEPVLCAAAFLAGGYDERFDRRYMLDRLEEEDRTYIQESFRNGRTNLAYVFDDVYGHVEGGRTSRICQEIQRHFEQQQEFGNPWFRSGLSATIYHIRGNDGIEVDARVEALAARAHPATAIATGITIRRAMKFTCPARCGIIYGFRRPPRVSDISDGRLKDLAAAAAPTICELGPLSGESPNALKDCFEDTKPVRLPPRGACACACYQIFGGDQDAEVFPLAVFSFPGRLPHELHDIPDMRVTLAVPVAIQGMVVAVVEVDNPIPGEPNVDLEYVGIEGYAYVPPGHEPVPPDHRL
jgi:hypothetical protein